MKRVRRTVELAISVIRRGGGLARTFKKAVRIYRREGLTGIKRVLRKVGNSQLDRNNYNEWIRRYDTPTEEACTIMSARIDSFVHKPLVSVIMPTYNPKAEWLIEAIESVRKQIYPYWELCIADDASTDKAIRPILEHYAKDDARIKVAFRAENGHISAASNTALQLAAGSWIALLDHDDLLGEHALFHVVAADNERPDIQMIYSDEDVIDEFGRRSDPYFKCDWNPDLFYSHNLVSHLGVYRTDLLTSIGGFREGFEGSQDYDLALRCIECIKPDQIHHIPRVLYHWRKHPGSTAESGDVKPYALLAGLRALNDHLQRLGTKAEAVLSSFGHGYRVRYTLPDVRPLVSLIIPTRNGLRVLKPCLDSILDKTTYANYEILIIDNGSDDPATVNYLNALVKDSRIRVVKDGRAFNYSALNNMAAKLARGELIGLLNDDIEVITPDWLSEMVAIAVQPRVGAVGARLWYPDKTLQHAGVILGIGGVASHAAHGLPEGESGYFRRAILQQGFSAMTAACLLVRKAVYEQVGGLNETELRVAFNDVDFCLRLREAGYRNVWTPYAELYHHESATRGQEDTPEKRARFAGEIAYMQRRWGDWLANDPAYTPNLTLQYTDFSLAWPPRIDPLS